jgi:hypothetical protein
MDPKNAKQSRMARGTNTVGEFHSRLDDDYEIVTHSECRITETGLLVVAELKPKNARHGLPGFLFRWDEKADHLNVDPIGVIGDQMEEFKSGKPGYAGHRPVRSSSESRSFCITIRWNNRTLYEGDITIPLKFETSIKERIGVSVSASVELLRHCRICGKQIQSCWKRENLSSLQGMKTIGSRTIEKAHPVQGRIPFPCMKTPRLILYCPSS